MRFSTFIQNNLDAIVAEWETFARTLVPAQHMTVLALRDHCREILLAVADEMELRESIKERSAKSKGHAESANLPESAATSHGALRQLSGFDLVQLVAEFRALRASVLALWQRYVGPGAETAAAAALRHRGQAFEIGPKAVFNVGDRLRRFSGPALTREQKCDVAKHPSSRTLRAGLGHCRQPGHVVYEPCLCVRSAGPRGSIA
jgi:RsbT co-antagonist protein rsbRD N-terminal domain